MELKRKKEVAESVDYSVYKAAHWAVEGAWHSLYNWVDALSEMPKGTFLEQEKIQRLKATVFKDGLSFLVLPYRDAWTQSEARLKLSADSGFDPVVAKLGGAPFLMNLKKAHANYGRVLGLVEPLSMNEIPLMKTRIRKLLSVLKFKLRLTGDCPR